MKKNIFIGAGSDLGVNLPGASLGPKVILKNLTSPHILLEQGNVLKSNQKNDLKKNLKEVNNFNNKLYNIIKKEKDFCITVGGDHSIAIASALASLEKTPNLGLIWIDSHLDYNTFQTTITGNIHGLPLACLNGLNKELSPFHNKTYFDPKKTVVVGYRAYEENAQAEIQNIKTMGVSVFTTKDIKEYGVNKIMEMALKIATTNTSGVHISFDLDVIDPLLASGVSVPEKNGLNLKEVAEIIKVIQKLDNLKSFDLVEYNPLFDKDNKTLQIALDILKKIAN